MPRAETIRGLARGLRVLAALQSSPISTLHEIHRATHISKPSLLRILNTLQDAGFVSRRLADGRYRISAFARVGRKRDRHDRVAEAAAPVLDRLCQNVRWPSDLMVPAGDHMERRETSQAASPFFVHPTYRNRVGQSIGWLLTGVGRAYLAFCPDKEREELLQRLRKSDKPDDWLARDRNDWTRFSPRRARGVTARAIRRSSAVIMEAHPSTTAWPPLPFRSWTTSGFTARSTFSGSRRPSRSKNLRPVTSATYRLPRPRS